MSEPGREQDPADDRGLTTSRASLLVASMAMLAIAAVATIAIVAITRADGPRHGPATSPIAPGQGPLEAIADLNDRGKEKWRSTLGKECDMDRLYIFVIASDPHGVDAITAPGRCRFDRIRITPEDGSVRPEDPLQIEFGPSGRDQE